MLTEYQKSLLDKRWIEKKNKILLRDGHSCKGANCPKNGGRLEVHHLEYIFPFKAWEYPDDMLITLCDYCHNWERFRKSVEKQLISALKQKGFFLSDLLAFSTMLYTESQFTTTLLQTLRTYQNGEEEER